MGQTASPRGELWNRLSRARTAPLRAGYVATGAGLAEQGSSQRPGAICGAAGGWLRGGAAELVTQAGEPWK